MGSEKEEKNSNLKKKKECKISGNHFEFNGKFDEHITSVVAKGNRMV